MKGTLLSTHGEEASRKRRSAPLHARAAEPGTRLSSALHACASGAAEPRRLPPPRDGARGGEADAGKLVRASMTARRVRF